MSLGGRARREGDLRRALLRETQLMVIVGEPGRAGAPEAVAEACLRGGARLFELRRKKARKRDLYDLALRLRERTARYGALLIVNDEADIALASGADGVHVGEDDLPVAAARRVIGPDRLVGATAHAGEAAARAIAEGCDYLGVGTIFRSPTKPDLPARGLDPIREIVALSASVPAFAIGGIARTNLSEVLRTGIHGVAVASAIAEAEDPERETRLFLEAIAAAGAPRS